MELQTHTDTAYRQLLPTEIRQLEQQGCTAENWQLIEVHPDIDLRHLAYVHFSGSNRIGNFQKTVTLPGGITFHTGIRHATLTMLYLLQVELVVYTDIQLISDILQEMQLQLL